MDPLPLEGHVSWCQHLERGETEVREGLLGASGGGRLRGMEGSAAPLTPTLHPHPHPHPHPVPAPRGSSPQEGASPPPLPPPSPSCTRPPTPAAQALAIWAHTYLYPWSRSVTAWDLPGNAAFEKSYNNCSQLLHGAPAAALIGAAARLSPGRAP